MTDFMAKMIRPKIGETCADFACGTGGFLTSWLKELSPQIGDSEEKLAQYNNSIYGIEKKQFPYMLCITNMLLHDIDVPQVYHDNSLIRDVDRGKESFSGRSGKFGDGRSVHVRYYVPT